MKKIKNLPGINPNLAEIKNATTPITLKAKKSQKGTLLKNLTNKNKTNGNFNSYTNNKLYYR